jgi:hypothetical protein
MVCLTVSYWGLLATVIVLVLGAALWMWPWA